MTADIAKALGGRKKTLQKQSVLIVFSPDADNISQPLSIFVTKREFPTGDKITVFIQHPDDAVRYGARLWTILANWARNKHNAYFRYIKRGNGCDVYSLDEYTK